MMHTDRIQLYVTCDGYLVPAGAIDKYICDANTGLLNDGKTKGIHFSTRLVRQCLVPLCDFFDGITIYLQ